MGEPVASAPAEIAAVADFAGEKCVDLTIIGPEDPLAAGIVDQFTRAGLKIFGPSAAASQLETSKAFANTIMPEANVPAADFPAFDDAETARGYVKALTGFRAVKADEVRLRKCL